jgi:hypothetical protein
MSGELLENRVVRKFHRHRPYAGREGLRFRAPRE